jgi:hypothetical protein
VARLVNRVVNPIVRAILRSPAHPLLSRWLVLITVAGRRTGREFTIPVGYRRSGEALTIRVEWPERKSWWRNLRGGEHRVGLVLAGRELGGEATVEGNEAQGVKVNVRIDPAPVARRSRATPQ